MISKNSYGDSMIFELEDTKQTSNYVSTVLRQRRKAREIASRYEKAALTIQRLWRGYFTVERKKKELVQCFSSFRENQFLRCFLFLVFSRQRYAEYISVLSNECSFLGLEKVKQLLYSSDTDINNVDLNLFNTTNGTEEENLPQLNCNFFICKKVFQTLFNSQVHSLSAIHGRNFFNSSSTIHSNNVSSKTKWKTHSALETARQAAFFYYKKRLAWCSISDLDLFNCVILPKAYDLLLSKKLPYSLAYKILYIYLTHTSLLSNTWGCSKLFPLNDNLALNFCLVLLQERPSIVSRFLILFKTVPIWMQQDFFNDQTVTILLQCLKDPSCAWQCRMIITVFDCLLLKGSETYLLHQQHIESLIYFFFFTKGEKFRGLLLEYFFKTHFTSNFIMLNCRYEALEAKVGQSKEECFVNQPKFSLKQCSEPEKSFKETPCFEERSFADLEIQAQLELPLDCSHTKCKNTRDFKTLCFLLCEAIAFPGPLALEQFLQLTFNPCYVCTQCLAFNFTFKTFMLFLQSVDVHSLFLLESLQKLGMFLFSIKKIKLMGLKEQLRTLTEECFIQRFIKNPQCNVLVNNKLSQLNEGNESIQKALEFVRIISYLYFPLEYNEFNKFFFDTTFNHQRIRLGENTYHVTSDANESDDDDGSMFSETNDQLQRYKKDCLFSILLGKASLKDDPIYSYPVTHLLCTKTGLVQGVLLLLQKKLLKEMGFESVVELCTTFVACVISNEDILHLSVVATRLLEARLIRNLESLDARVEGLEKKLYAKTLETSFIPFTTLVYFVNRATSFLLQKEFNVTGQLPIENVKKQTSALLLSRSLRQLYRLKTALLPEEDWITPNSLLKSTEDLMEKAEKFHSWQYTFVRNGELIYNNDRPAHVTLKKDNETIRGLGMLLTRLPHAVRFHDRSLILTLLTIDEKLTKLGVLCDNPLFIRHGTHFQIRRSHLVEDTLHSMNKTGFPGWKHPIAITFIDQFGNPEKGVDGGGLFREYLTLLARAIFSPGFGLFEAQEDQSLVPCCSAYTNHADETDELFRLAGCIVGKALYEHILLEPVLSHTFLNEVRKNDLPHSEDLPFLDPILYKHLESLELQENIHDLGLTFSATVFRGHGHVEEVDLIKNGRSIPVEKEQFEMYRKKLTMFHVKGKFPNETAMFRMGLTEVLPHGWLSIFNGSEFSELVSGKDQYLNIEDLASHVIYSGGFNETSVTIQYLWMVLKKMTNTMQKKFLMFVTGCPRPPFLGFAMLQPPMKIQKVDDTLLLPTASTCINQFNLPAYESYDKLKEKLYKAFEMTEGFELY